MLHRERRCSESCLSSFRNQRMATRRPKSYFSVPLAPTPRPAMGIAVRFCADYSHMGDGTFDEVELHLRQQVDQVGRCMASSFPGLNCS